MDNLEIDTEVVVGNTNTTTNSLSNEATAGTKSRSYFFTINNVTDDEKRLFSELDTSYKMFQIERGDNNGVIHLQGVVYYTNARSWDKLKKTFPRANIQITKNFNAAVEYCSKEETRIEGPFESGDRPHQGLRSDLVMWKDMIMAGETNCREIRLNAPNIYHLYGRTLEAIETDYRNKLKRNFMTKGLWLWGDTGCGKSYIAQSIGQEAGGGIYTHTIEDKGWWDDYEQQETVIIDDFRGEIKYNELLKLVDRYPHKVSRRGKNPVSFMSKLLIITSSLPPDQVYKNRNLEDKIEQLNRRFEIVYID